MKLEPRQRYTPFPIQKNCFIGLRSQASLSISAPSGCRGLYAHAYGIFTPFYSISLQIYMGGYNAARGLISRDIAYIVTCTIGYLLQLNPV